MMPIRNPNRIIKLILDGVIDEMDAINFYNKIKKEKCNKSDYKMFMIYYNRFFDLLYKKNFLRQHSSLPKRRVNTKD